MLARRHPVLARAGQLAAHAAREGDRNAIGTVVENGDELLEGDPSKAIARHAQDALRGKIGIYDDTFRRAHEQRVGCIAEHRLQALRRTGKFVGGRLDGDCFCVLGTRKSEGDQRRRSDGKQRLDRRERAGRVLGGASKRAQRPGNERACDERKRPRSSLSWWHLSGAAVREVRSKQLQRRSECKNRKRQAIQQNFSRGAAPGIGTARAPALGEKVSSGPSCDQRSRADGQFEAGAATAVKHISQRLRKGRVYHGRAVRGPSSTADSPAPIPLA